MAGPRSFLLFQSASFPSAQPLGGTMPLATRTPISACIVISLSLLLHSTVFNGHFSRGGLFSRQFHSIGPMMFLIINALLLPNRRAIVCA